MSRSEAVLGVFSLSLGEALCDIDIWDFVRLISIFPVVDDFGLGSSMGVNWWYRNSKDAGGNEGRGFWKEIDGNN